VSVLRSERELVDPSTELAPALSPRLPASSQDPYEDTNASTPTRTWNSAVPALPREGSTAPPSRESTPSVVVRPNSPSSSINTNVVSLYSCWTMRSLGMRAQSYLRRSLRILCPQRPLNEILALLLITFTHLSHRCYYHLSLSLSLPACLRVACSIHLPLTKIRAQLWDVGEK
jgi:hypothetical protein